jgi:MarR family transcriptional regulator, lower aerobic nicotinate degradation pathway regulator
MVLIPRLAKQILRRSDEALLGMHMRDLIALSYLRDHDGAPQQDLADVMTMDPNNVVLVLNDLENLGHISRRRDSNDRRRHRVELTQAGAEALERAEAAQRGVQEDILRALDPDERDTLWRLLSRVVQSAEPEIDP